MRKRLWNVTRIGAATTGFRIKGLGTNWEGAKSLNQGSPRNSVGEGVCLLTKKANLTKLLLRVAYRFSLLKSHAQLYRSYTEFVSLPRRSAVLAVCQSSYGTRLE
jgi:hypothetical protein